MRAECLEQANRAILRSAPAGPPAAVLLAVIVGDASPASARIGLVVAVTLTNIFGILSVLRYRAVRQRRTVTSWWPIPVYGFLIGCSWASLAVFGLPDGQHVDMRAIIALFAAGTSATQIVSAAAHRLYFFAAQIPLLGVLTAVYITSGDHTTYLLGFAFPIYMVVMVTLHHDVNKVVVSEIELKHANQDLIANLKVEQLQTESANSRLVEANEQLTAQATRDGLTGLANRQAFLDLLDRALLAARRDGAVVGVLFFDVDRFKLVNDSLGHASGDELLVAVAERVQRALRPVDTLGRLGGDEFVVLLPALGDSYEAAMIAERIRASLAEPIGIVGRRVRVTVSIGVATTLHSRDTATDLLRHADAAQYNAKQNGRDRVEVFDIELRERVQRIVDTEIELREALAANQIVPYFQPQVDVETGAVVGAEALARWLHPERGMITPDVFLPLAEATGLMYDIDIAMMVQSVQARAHLAALGVDPAFRVWSNIAPGVLARGNQTERLAAYLREVGCDPIGIGIEITETGVLFDLDAARAELRAARRLGLRVALDDFGTGHSSLSLLRDLPIDEVKIDRSFVRDLADDPVDAAIVAGVTEIARRIGLDVVAEGVETSAQDAEIRALGCARAQGWRYGKPMPFARLVERLGLSERFGVADRVEGPRSDADSRLLNAVKPRP